MKSRL